MRLFEKDFYVLYFASALRIVCRYFNTMHCIILALLGMASLILYYTIQNFGGRKFRRITSDSPKFSCPIFSPLIS